MTIKPISTDDYILKAQLVHGNRYDYSRVVYTGTLSKVEIICREHGPFIMTAKNHVNGANGYIGSGCPGCATDQKRPSHHLLGSGCSQCANSSASQKLLLSFDEFKQRANKFHEDRYDYSQSLYNGLTKNIQIICRSHGIFEMQQARHHLDGYGCPRCRNIERNTIFFNKVEEVHGDRFSYDSSFYVSCKNKLSVYCKDHGEFLITPESLLRGHGCPKCSASGVELEWLDKLQVPVRQKRFKIKGLTHPIFVDGFDPASNTIYEFHGDFWHGNPRIFNQSETHPILAPKTYGMLYERTKNREDAIINAVFNLVVMWECDWKQLRNVV